jgi:hypothetical protein
VIETDEQMALAERCVSNLKHVLLRARKVHPAQDYARLAAPILLEVQQREQEILECLSSATKHVSGADAPEMGLTWEYEQDD